MTIQTVDNYNLLEITSKTKSKERDDFLSKNSYYCLSDTNNIEELKITLENFKKSSKNNTLFSFLNKDEKDDDKKLIVCISKEDEDKYIAKTGNFIGNFTYKGVQIEIKSRFSDDFLKRMLNFANDVYLDDVDVAGKVEKKDKKSVDYSKFVIYYMFIQKLEKAFLLGIPKAYKSIKHHEMRVKGNIDINRFIKHDIPFRGKISSTSREQKEIQEVIDVLYKAVSIIEKDMPSFLKNVLHVKIHLKQHRSKNYVSNQTMQKALNSKALQNPIFAPYKKVLEYAQLIINSGNIEQNSKAKDKTFGFLVDVSELFEIYLVKLLRWKMPDWDITHEPPTTLYEDNFYERKIKPDIVMKKDNDIMVFDAKYKKMKFTEGLGDGKIGDLDRSDFFQIHTYMSYYHNQKDNLIAGGLLYPMEGDFDQDKCYSENWLGNSDVKFIVDGIVLSEKTEDEQELSKIDLIKKREDDFIGRLESII